MHGICSKLLRFVKINVDFILVREKGITTLRIYQYFIIKRLKHERLKDAKMLRTPEINFKDCSEVRPADLPI